MQAMSMPYSLIYPAHSPKPGECSLRANPMCRFEIGVKRPSRTLSRHRWCLPSDLPF